MVILRDLADRDANAVLHIAPHVPEGNPITSTIVPEHVYTFSVEGVSGAILLVGAARDGAKAAAYFVHLVYRYRRGVQQVDAVARGAAHHSPLSCTNAGTRQLRLHTPPEGCAFAS